MNSWIYLFFIYVLEGNIQWNSRIFKVIDYLKSSIVELRQPRLLPIEALSVLGGEYRSQKEGRNFDCSDSLRILPDSRVLA